VKPNPIPLLRPLRPPHPPFALPFHAPRSPRSFPSQNPERVTHTSPGPARNERHPGLRPHNNPTPSPIRWGRGRGEGPRNAPSPQPLPPRPAFANQTPTRSPPWPPGTPQPALPLPTVMAVAGEQPVNIAIMRAFVRLREMLLTNADLARKLADLERKYDSQFKAAFDAIRQLMAPPPPNRQGRQSAFTSKKIPSPTARGENPGFRSIPHNSPLIRCPLRPKSPPLANPSNHQSRRRQTEGHRRRRAPVSPRLTGARRSVTSAKTSRHYSPSPTGSPRSRLRFQLPRRKK